MKKWAVQQWRMIAVNNTFIYVWNADNIIYKLEVEANIFINTKHI